MFVGRERKAQDRFTSAITGRGVTEISSGEGQFRTG